jgi:hypothetical protein
VRELSILAADLGGVLLIGWIVAQVRRDRLYVGYAGIVVLAIAAAAVAVTWPPALGLVNRLGIVFTHAAGVLALLLAFMFLMVIYMLGQLTLLSNRIAALTQAFAIERAGGPSEAAPKHDGP